MSNASPPDGTLELLHGALMFCCPLCNVTYPIPFCVPRLQTPDGPAWELAHCHDILLSGNDT